MLFCLLHGECWPEAISAQLGQLRLDLVLRGIKTTQGKQGLTPKQKLPIIPIFLRQLRKLWSGPNQGFKESLLWAVCAVCFFGFLRAGEIMQKSIENFDPSYHLSLGDVAADSLTDPSFIQLSLKGSKTDPFRKGVTITIGKTGELLCPVQALCNYLLLRGNSQGPLFIQEDGTPHKIFLCGEYQRGPSSDWLPECQSICRT